MAVLRSPLVVTISVWKALFLREAVARISATRTAWVWLLLEPAFHITLLMFIFTVIRQRHVGGINTPLWVMVGLLAFFMFRRSATQAQNAISANQALFAYRQVKPVDTVMVRAGVEGFLMTVIAILLFSVAGFFGLDVIPADPLAALEAFVGLWMFGLGFGLVVSVAIELVPEFGKILGMLMAPLYFISGVIFPVGKAPPPYREWLLLNPIAHGIEATRLGFAPYYHAFPELSLGYLYTVATATIFFGLMLQRRFALRLVAR